MSNFDEEKTLDCNLFNIILSSKSILKVLILIFRVSEVF